MLNFVRVNLCVHVYICMYDCFVTFVQKQTLIL